MASVALEPSPLPVSHVARRLVELAKELDASISQLQLSNSDSGIACASSMSRLTLAKKIYAARARRNDHLGIEVSGEPSWDLMLDLYISDWECRDVSITSACIASRAPVTTALRYIRHLIEAGAVLRVHCPTDKRVEHLRLTPKMHTKIETFLDGCLRDLSIANV